jgi:hypothetical protein
MKGRPFEKGKSGNPGGRPKVIADLRLLARAHAPEAIKELARLATKARSETARIAAIRELLDRAYGKATQYVGAEHEVTGVSGDDEVSMKISFVTPRANGHDPDQDR